MEEYFYTITFATDLGKTKQLRISDADHELTREDMETPMDNIMISSIFDREDVGRLEVIKALVLEKVQHTVYEY